MNGFHTSYQLHELPEVAKTLLTYAGHRKIMLFHGPMGSGKTTLIKEMAKQLGSEDHFSSPTFSIVNEYSSPAGRICHFDLYRVRHTSELLDIGFEEYLDSGDYCFIEWPELALPLIEDDFLNVAITVNENVRYISATFR